MKRLGLAALLLLALTCKPAERPKYNVLLVTLDTFRADRLDARAPNLSRLASEGVRFANAQTAVPLTLPAHATILSGLLPLHHGLRNNGAGSFPVDKATLSTTLGANGYRTGAFVGAFVLDRRFGLDRGFEIYDDDIERDPTIDLALETERKAGVVVDRALAWLAREDARPFFAWVHLWDAHAPYAPPAPHPQTYDGEVAYVDAQLARLLNAVDRTKTVVVVVGDHGEALGEHGELTHGLLLYQPTLHVPLVVAAPEIKTRVVEAAVGTVDLAPTIASLAGASMATADGRDLAADLREGREPAKNDVYAETQYPLTFGWSELAALRRENLKLISGPAPELYDIARDPSEAANVLAEQRRQFRELASKLDALRATAVTTQTAAVDEETKAKLASLGYVAPAPVAGSGARPDPKSMAPLFTTFEQALASIGRGDSRAAIEPLTQLVARDPSNPVFRSTLARVQRTLGSGSSAIALYREAVALTPTDPDAWYNLGVALTESGHPGEAIKVLGEAVRLQPRRAEAHDALGFARIESGDLERAVESFRAAVAVDPRSARSWNNLGNALRAGGVARDAEAAYRRALELSPRYADPRNGLGVLLVQSGRAREAVTLFDEAIRLRPDLFEALLNRGIALQESGDVRGAAAQYRSLLEKLPAGSQYRTQREAARTLLGRVDNP